MKYYILTNQMSYKSTHWNIACEIACIRLKVAMTVFSWLATMVSAILYKCKSSYSNNDGKGYQMALYSVVRCNNF